MLEEKEKRQTDCARVLHTHCKVLVNISMKFVHFNPNTSVLNPNTHRKYSSVTMRMTANISRRTHLTIRGRRQNMPERFQLVIGADRKVAAAMARASERRPP